MEAAACIECEQSRLGRRLSAEQLDGQKHDPGGEAAHQRPLGGQVQQVRQAAPGGAIGDDGFELGIFAGGA